MVRSGRWDVVCGVRDPVARAASALYQIGGSWEDTSGDDESVAALSESVIGLFDAGRAGLDWFDTQLCPVTGIDVFDEPFDVARGWQIFANDRFRVLVFRFEDISRVAGSALAGLLGLAEAPDVPHRNEGSAKSYAEVYDRFKQTVDLPDRLLDRAYSSRLATHFYTADELAGFRARWKRT
jgi:hypothetical protein